MEEGGQYEGYHDDADRDLFRVVVPEGSCVVVGVNSLKKNGRDDGK